MGSYESLFYLVHRGPMASPSLTASMRVTVRAWDRAQKLMNMRGTEDLPKMRSAVYKELFVVRPKMLAKCKDTWSALVTDFGGEDWDDMLDHPFQTLESARNRLIQFKILRRVYFTPARIAGTYGTGEAEYWRCTTDNADFDYIFWQCQLIQEFWKGVTHTIQKVLLVHVPVTVAVCLLGLVEELTPRRAQRTMISLALFYARKAILLCWKKPSPPTVSFRKDIINKALPFYKATYLRRGCPKKFEKVWQNWLDAKFTVN